MTELHTAPGTDYGTVPVGQWERERGAGGISLLTVYAPDLRVVFRGDATECPLSLQGRLDPLLERR